MPAERGNMELECKAQKAAYTEKKDDTKVAAKPQEDNAKEREFWLSAKYADELYESER